MSEPTTSSQPSLSTKRPRRRKEASIRSLSLDLAALRKQHDALTLQLNAAHTALTEIATIENTTTNEIALRALSELGNPTQLVAEVQARAKLELGKDVRRLDFLDWLAASGAFGLHVEQLRGSFLQFRRAEDRERDRVGLWWGHEIVRRLVDAAVAERKDSWSNWKVYLPEKVRPTWK